MIPTFTLQDIFKDYMDSEASYTTLRCFIRQKNGNAYDEHEAGSIFTGCPRCDKHKVPGKHAVLRDADFEYMKSIYPDLCERDGNVKVNQLYAFIFANFTFEADESDDGHNSIEYWQFSNEIMRKSAYEGLQDCNDELVTRIANLVMFGMASLHFGGERLLLTMHTE